MVRGAKKKSNLTYLIFLIVLLALASLFFVNFMRQNQPADYSDKNVRINISTISTFDYSEVPTVESRIRQIENVETRGNFNVNKGLTNDQYRKIFSTSIIIGDSITEGLTAYGYLGEDIVFSKIGASVINGDDLFESAAATYPKFAFFAFGMNDMGNYNGNSVNFIEKYTELIKNFKLISPDTRIYVNSISTPSKAAIEQKNSVKKYKEFNEAIRKMCKELKVTYIDNSYILEENSDLYAGDGIHVTSGYYPIWMNNMILKAGL